MNTYYVMYEKDKPMFDDRVLEGETPVDAVRRAYPGKNIIPVYGDNAKNADVILIKCRIVADSFAAGQIRIQRHAHSCCYQVM